MIHVLREELSPKVESEINRLLGTRFVRWAHKFPPNIVSVAYLPGTSRGTGVGAVALLNNRPLSTKWRSKARIWSQSAHIEYLAAKHKSNGLGSELVRQICAEAAQHHRAVSAEVRYDNTSARAFFEAHGFKFGTRYKNESCLGVCMPGQCPIKRPGFS